jgi:MIP family channel proteins
MPIHKAFIAEFIGTFALMFVGGGAIIVNAGSGHELLAAALAHGLILAAFVPATMHISGGQFNPAVSIALAVIGKQTWLSASVFIITQLLAVTIAAAMLKWLLAETYEVGNLGATLGRFSSGEHADAARVVVLEIIATFFLMAVIMGGIVDNRGLGRTKAIGGFCVGIVVAAVILCFGPLTGASMNPARSFGPALVADEWTMHWAYWLAPTVGALLAAVSYHLSFGSSEVDSYPPEK